MKTIKGLKKDIRRDWMLLLIVLPGAVYFLLWSHVRDTDGIQGLQYLEGNMGESVGRDEAFQGIGGFRIFWKAGEKYISAEH